MCPQQFISYIPGGDKRTTSVHGLLLLVWSSVISVTDCFKINIYVTKSQESLISSKYKFLKYIIMVLICIIFMALTFHKRKTYTNFRCKKPHKLHFMYCFLKLWFLSFYQYYSSSYFNYKLPRKILFQQLWRNYSMERKFG